MPHTISPDLKFAVVCSHNMNRSMEAHRVLAKKNLKVKSYGTGGLVKLPGPSADKPNVYSFDWTYDKIHKDLSRKDVNMYTENGILSLLDRNRRIKRNPEKFQDVKAYDFNVVFCCEERVFDQAIEHLYAVASEAALEQRNDVGSLHLVNIKIIDNHEDAILGSNCIADLAAAFVKSNDLDVDIDKILKNFADKHPNRGIFHTQFFV